MNPYDRGSLLKNFQQVLLPCSITSYFSLVAVYLGVWRGAMVHDDSAQHQAASTLQTLPG